MTSERSGPALLASGASNVAAGCGASAPRSIECAHTSSSDFAGRIEASGFLRQFSRRQVDGDPSRPGNSSCDFCSARACGRGFPSLRSRGKPTRLNASKPFGEMQLDRDQGRLHCRQRAGIDDGDGHRTMMPSSGLSNQAGLAWSMMSVIGRSKRGMSISVVARNS